VEPIPHAESSDYEIQHSPIGNKGRPASFELAGFFMYLLSLAGFVVWLLVWGVNV
jgi:hypothetical protein